MSKFSKGSIVKHQSGEIRGEIINVFDLRDEPVGYYVKWDDGTLSYHPEQALSWASIDRPRMHYTQQSIK